MSIKPIGEVIENLRNKEINYILECDTKLSRYCMYDDYLSEIISILYSNIWNPQSLNYYKQQGLMKIFSDEGKFFNKKNDDTHTEIIANLLEFVESHIHIEKIDKPRKTYYGVYIEVNDDSIKCFWMDFNDEDKMRRRGFHNDAKYIIESVKDYATNCFFKN